MLFFAWALLLFAGCQTQPQKGYQLVATLGDVPDSTQVFLQYALDNKSITDTTYVIDNQFAFSDTIENPFYASLIIKGEKRDVKGLYIEKGKIIVKSADLLKNAEVISPMNIALKEWTDIDKPFDEGMEELNSKWTAASDDEKKNPAFMEKLNLVADSLTEARKGYAVDFVKSHPDSYFSLHALFPIIMGYKPDVAYADSIFALYSPELRATEAGQKVAKQIESWKNVAIGATAPDFTQNDPEGKPVKLSDFRGKYLLIDFWASWCVPCRKENPNVVKAYQKYKNKNFDILGVSLDGGNDSLAKWTKAIEADKLAWTQVSDLKGWDNEVSQRYGVRGIPANFLLDPEGKIIAKDLRGDDLDKKLAEILK
jgi:peroxiredoxin